MFTLLLATAITATIAFTPHHTEAHGDFYLDHAPPHVFSMFEPIGEKRWADGWDPKPIFPADIAPKEGTVFTSVGHNGQASIWTITSYSPPKMVAYCVFSPGFAVTQIRVTCRPEGTKSHVFVDYRITGLSEAGNAYATKFSEGFDPKMGHWRTHIQQALAHG